MAGLRGLLSLLLLGLLGMSGVSAADELTVHDNSPGFCQFGPSEKVHEHLYGEGGC